MAKPLPYPSGFRFWLMVRGGGMHSRINRWPTPSTKAGRFKFGKHHRSIGERMAGKSEGSGITSLPGVGAATAKKLKAAKLGTVAKLAKASLGDLQKAGLTAAAAKKVLAAAKAAGSAKKAAKKAGGKAANVAKKAASKAKTTSKKAASATLEASQKAVGKGQTVATKVVEKTKAAGTSLKTTNSKDRKGSTIKVPRSVKDMPWFKKG